MVEPIFQYQFRFILIGDSTVGKSSLLKFFTDGRFAEVHFFPNLSLFSSYPFGQLFAFPMEIILWVFSLALALGQFLCLVATFLRMALCIHTFYSHCQGENIQVTQVLRIFSIVFRAFSYSSRIPQWVWISSRV